MDGYSKSSGTSHYSAHTWCRNGSFEGFFPPMMAIVDAAKMLRRRVQESN